jgi:L-cysteine/cystine lyase
MTGIPPAQVSPIALDQHRQHFSALYTKAYFNYGGQGPLPQAALAAMQQSWQRVQQEGPFGGQVNRWLASEGDRTRAAMAAELGTTAAAITLTEDVSMGCNIALWGLDWQYGDRLLLSDCEHPGIIAAAQELHRRLGVEIITFPLRETLNEGDPVAVLAQHLHPNTRLVVLSHILWNTGQVLPLAEMVAACHSYSSRAPVRVLVDAAQSVGVLPLNLTELQADFYAFTGHKWWCGPEGVGGLYVRPEVRDSLSPTFIGWRSITSDATGQPTGWQADGRRYEIATSAYPLYAGLREAIALHHQWGTAEARYQRICTLSHYLWQKLMDLPGVSCLRTRPPEAGLVSFQVPGQSHAQLVQALEAQSILVRTILHPDCVRACVHYLTLEAECDRLVAAIQAWMMGEKIPG